jgi:hypothetical protein
LYDIVDLALIQRWSGRGPKPRLSTRDAFFMTLLYLRNYSSYIELARVFGCRENAALDTVARVVSTIRVPLLEALVQPLRKHVQLAKGKFLDRPKHYKASGVINIHRLR